MRKQEDHLTSPFGFLKCGNVCPIFETKGKYCRTLNIQKVVKKSLLRKQVYHLPFE
jgi:hypothetical protein